MPNNDFFNNSFLKNDPTDLFRDLGKQVLIYIMKMIIT